MTTFVQCRARAVAALAGLLLALPCFAQTYPDKPIKWVVPYPPGGTTDVVARSIAQAMGERLGVAIVIENKGGAAGVIGMQTVAKAAPDGYTFLVSDASLATAPSLNKQLSFDPAKDLQAVFLFVTVPHVVLVSPDSGIQTLADLLARGKQDPEKLYFASGGIGSPLHLSGEALRTSAGIKWVHVPYKGGGPAILAVMSGDAQIVTPSLPSVMGHIQSGKLKALAVTSSVRLGSLPNIPSVAELGYPGAAAMGWIGLHAPTGLPVEILQRTQGAAKLALSDSVLTKRLQEQGSDLAVDASASAYALFVANEAKRWEQIVKAAGIQAE
ncbi:MAG: tripartite tricarboxylate transporter substrate binding protein [Alcaligenaceae bacterium]